MMQCMNIIFDEDGVWSLAVKGEGVPPSRDKLQTVLEEVSEIIQESEDATVH